MQQPHPQARQLAGLQLLVGGLRPGRLHLLGLLDERAHHVRLPAGGDLGPQPLPHGGLPGRLGHRRGGDAGPPGGQLVEARHVQVAVDGHGGRARDRRGRHDQQVRQAAGAAGTQGGALLHAEAVLLVHHGQAQGLEGHALADEGVRAHHHGDVPGGEAAEDALARRGADATRQQLQGHRRQAAEGQPPAAAPDAAGAVQRPQQLAETQEVLLGQHLGGRHQGGLAAAADHRQHGHQRHHRLARTHLSLQQPVHRPRLAQVGQDLGDGAGLGPGQLERQPPAEALQQFPVHPVGDALAGALALALAAHQHHLHPQQLVEDQPVPAHGHLGEGLRAVHQPQGLVAPAQVVVRQHLRRHGVGDAAPLAAPQPLAHHVGDLPGGDGRPGRERVDGEDAAGAVTHQVHHRVGHLGGAPVRLQAPVQQGLHALAQLLGAPRLVEEHAVQPVALPVAEQHLHPLAAVAPRHGPHPLDGGQNGGVLAHLQFLHGGLPAAVQVAAGVVGQQVAQVRHAQLPQRLHPRPGGAVQALQGDPGQVPPGQRRGRLSHRSAAPPGPAPIRRPRSSGRGAGRRRAPPARRAAGRPPASSPPPRCPPRWPRRRR